jgi:hypothetical protein
MSGARVELPGGFSLPPEAVLSSRRCLAPLPGSTGRIRLPNLDLANLVVSDMEATVAFYRRLGLTIPDTDAAFQTHHRTSR